MASNKRRYTPVEKKPHKNMFYWICTAVILAVILAVAAYFIWIEPQMAGRETQGESSSSITSGMGGLESSSHTDSSDSSSQAGENDGTVSSQGGDGNSQAFEEKFSENPIDTAFENAMNGAGSVTAMINVYGEYTQKWMEEVDNAYEKLKTLSPDNLADIQAEQGRWESGVENEIAQKQDGISQEGNLGNIALEKSKVAYDAYRERAEELYRYIYEAGEDFSVGDGAQQ